MREEQLIQVLPSTRSCRKLGALTMQMTAELDVPGCPSNDGSQLYGFFASQSADQQQESSRRKKNIFMITIHESRIDKDKIVAIKVT